MGRLTKDGFLRVGIPWGFNEWTEVDGYFSDLIYSRISIVDFIPVIPTVNKQALESVKNDKKLTYLLKNIYAPDPEKGCSYYNGLLRRVGLVNSCDEVKGIRLYLTDSTQVGETLSNTYDESLMHQIISKVTNNKVTQTISDIKKTLGKALYAPPAELANLITENKPLKNALSTIESLLSGMRIDFPVVWRNTDYTRRVSFNVVLSSPYGHPEAVWVWIVRPLLYVILLGTPVNWYGPVGYPLYVTINSPGLLYMKLGAIESISIDRGGANTRFNIYKQPLKVVLNITVRDLYSSLSLDPEEQIDAKSVVTNIRSTDDVLEFSSNINSMPTVAKLVKSFAPFKEAGNMYKSDMNFHNRTGTDFALTEQQNQQSTTPSITQPTQLAQTILEEESNKIKDNIDYFDDLLV